MSIGTEHEFSINDHRFTPLPVSDEIIKTICGRYASEILFGDIKLGKELQKTVLEIIPRTPADDLFVLEAHLVAGIRRFYRIFRDKYLLLGLGMHPTLTLDQTAVWNHDEGEYYRAYDRLFNIRQHGWLNLQALQINLSYGNNRELVTLYNRLRSLLPYLIAVTASSPMVEGRLTGHADNRLKFYLKNQREMPLICNRIIPEKINGVADYRALQEEIFSGLRARGADILCEEWVNSGGIIIRFSRKCVEIRALDEQESIHADMAVCAFVRALLRCRSLPIDTDRESLLSLTRLAIQYGTAELKGGLEKLYALAWQHATAEERRYLPVIKERISKGSLAEQISCRYRDEGDMMTVLTDLAVCLKNNQTYPKEQSDFQMSNDK
jgi:gamma-glutamyl:cysteine ligase YbdK (ATP-grasp superfamily)